MVVVIGDGPQRSALEQELPEAIFCGSQRGEALASHYASGDVFVFPSLTETFGNVVLEALASGLGVVAYDQAAAAQHIRHGYNGVLAMPGDEEAFCDAARWLLEERETLRCVRLNARQHASRQGWASVIEQFEAQLRGFARSNRRCPRQCRSAEKHRGQALLPQSCQSFTHNVFAEDQCGSKACPR